MIALDLLAHPGAESVSFQRRSRFGTDALEGLRRLVGARAVVIDEARSSPSVPCRIAFWASSGQLVPAVVELEAVGLAQRLERLVVIAARATSPRARSAPSRSERCRFRHDQVRVDVQLRCRGRRRPGRRRTGLLNENSRGSISGMVKPETGQANFSENSTRSCVSLSDLLAEPPRRVFRRQRLVGELGDRDAVGELQRRSRG